MIFSSYTLIKMFKPKLSPLGLGGPLMKQNRPLYFLTEVNTSKPSQRPRYLLNKDIRLKIFVVKGVGIVSVFFICVSILTFCLKTHPDMRVPIINNITVRTSANTTGQYSYCCTINNITVRTSSPSEPQ